mmetsp:Transcript_100757/g.194750  ORF Transcript_100757/g.194750 Transcript_100757/m.194750 type:complete len:635 (+) Transcript_100757:67-1971(+)
MGRAAPWLLRLEEGQEAHVTGGSWLTMPPPRMTLKETSWVHATDACRNDDSIAYAGVSQKSWVDPSETSTIRFESSPPNFTIGFNQAKPHVHISSSTPPQGTAFYGEANWVRLTDGSRSADHRAGSGMQQKYLSQLSVLTPRDDPPMGAHVEQMQVTAGPTAVPTKLMANFAFGLDKAKPQVRIPRRTPVSDTSWILSDDSSLVSAPPPSRVSPASSLSSLPWTQLPPLTAQDQPMLGSKHRQPAVANPSSLPTLGLEPISGNFTTGIAEAPVRTALEQQRHQKPLQNQRKQWAKAVGKAVTAAALVMHKATKTAAKGAWKEVVSAAVAVPPPAPSPRTVLHTFKNKLDALKGTMAQNREVRACNVQSTQREEGKEEAEGLHGDLNWVAATLHSAKAHLVCTPALAQITVKAIAQDAHLMQNAANGLKSNRNFVLQAVRKNGGVLQHVVPRLQADREVVLAAVNQNGAALRFAHRSFRSDREVVLAAVKNHGEALALVSEEFRGDKHVVLSAVRNCGKAFEHANHRLQIDKGTVLEAVRHDSRALEYCHKALHSDQEVVIASMSSPGSLRFVQGALQSDKELAVRALKAKLQHSRQTCRRHIRTTPSCWTWFTTQVGMPQAWVANCGCMGCKRE